jgi:hypothetical protein
VTRLAAAVLVLVLVAFPLAVLPAPPVTWLAVAALVVAGAGVAILSVPVATIGAAFALVAYALALVITRPPVAPLAGIAIGATLVLLLTLVHFASRIQGAAVGRAVIVAQLRQWLVIVAIGAGTALALTAVAAGLGTLLLGAALPVVVVVAVLGALLTVAGVIALVTDHADPAAPADL